MQKKEFKNLAEQYTAVPVYRRLMADVLTPVSLFLNIREGAEYPFLLESVEGGEQLARYSFLGKDPYQVLKYERDRVSLKKEGEAAEELLQDYFTALKELTARYDEPKLPDLPRLTGGAVGFSSYDTIRQIEDLPDSPEDDLHVPEAIWAFYDEVYAFDHVKQQAIIIKTVFIDESTDLDAAYGKAIQNLDKMESQVYG